MLLKRRAFRCEEFQTFEIAPRRGKAKDQIDDEFQFVFRIFESKHVMLTIKQHRGSDFLFSFLFEQLVSILSPQFSSGE